MKTKDNVKQESAETGVSSFLPRNFIDVTWRIEFRGLPGRIHLSEALEKILFDSAKHQDIFELWDDPDFPCAEIREKFATAALVLASACASADPRQSISVVMPPIEGTTDEKTPVKVIKFGTEETARGFLILLEGEPEPDAFERYQLEHPADDFEDEDDWFI